MPRIFPNPSHEAGGSGPTGNPVGAIMGDGVKKLIEVAGVIRNHNDGLGWRLITAPETPLHASLNVTSVSSNGSAITVRFDGLGITNVISFVCGPDEKLAEQGFWCGASVQVDNALITLKRQRQLSDFVQFSGGVFVSANNVFTPDPGGLNAANGIIRFTHAKCKTNNDGHTVSLTSRGGVLMPVAESMADTYSDVKFVDWAGTTQLAGSGNMRFFLDRGPVDVVEDPSTVHTGRFPGCNCWFRGVFETS